MQNGAKREAKCSPLGKRLRAVINKCTLFTTASSTTLKRKQTPRTEKGFSMELDSVARGAFNELVCIPGRDSF